MDNEYDVVVVGGGAAGLAGALALARARRSVLVLDAGDPRNAPADQVHNYLGREGTPPAELYALGRDEVTGYGAEVVRGTATAAEAADGGFRVSLADGGSVRARRLLVTTGLTDVLPDVPGLADRWARDVLHCPYCHGWETRGKAIGVLSTGPLAVHQALLWRQWSDDVTLFRHTGPEPTGAEWEQLAARGIAVVDGEVVAVRTEGDRLTGLRLADGTEIAREALAVASVMTARSAVLESLGLEPVEQRMGEAVVGIAVPADPTGATAVPGVWVAGNVVDVTAQVIVAAAAGMRAGAMINADLVAEDTRRAVEARQVAPA